MNSTTTNVNFPRASSVLFVGSLWLAAITAMLVVHLGVTTSALEFVGTLVAAALVAFGSAGVMRTAVVVGRDEKMEHCSWSLPRVQSRLSVSKAKAV